MTITKCMSRVEGDDLDIGHVELKSTCDNLTVLKQKALT
eukprot:CAMPEP_0172488598 /NCGR_PEP_ID=MMETSP1066-20121228/18218_1 /TAXON_ID=671091 /ORGANISM="Coscinodiscus wailesii, Strain CCMP2513" /LENGTH=38 /DNA_ID= /DNA_START= /DNA_END= /DNA_ORIENTATION=